MPGRGEAALLFLIFAFLGFLAFGSRFRVIYYKPHWHAAGCAGAQPGCAAHV